MAEQAERIVGSPGAKPRRMRPRGRLAAVHADLPCRAMADRRLFLISRDSVVAHSGEEVIGGVVLAYVPEAEPPIFVLAISSFGRAMRRRGLATWPFADGMLGTQAPVLVGLHPNAI